MIVDRAMRNKPSSYRKKSSPIVEKWGCLCAWIMLTNIRCFNSGTNSFRGWPVSTDRSEARCVGPTRSSSFTMAKNSANYTILTSRPFLDLVSLLVSKTKWYSTGCSGRLLADSRPRSNHRTAWNARSYPSDQDGQRTRCLSCSTLPQWPVENSHCRRLFPLYTVQSAGVYTSQPSSTVCAIDWESVCKIVWFLCWSDQWSDWRRPATVNGCALRSYRPESHKRHCGRWSSLGETPLLLWISVSDQAGSVSMIRSLPFP